MDLSVTADEIVQLAIVLVAFLILAVAFVAAFAIAVAGVSRRAEEGRRAVVQSPRRTKRPHGRAR